MNHKMIRYTLFWAVKIVSVFMAASCVVSLIYHEYTQGIYYLVTAAVAFLISTIFTLKKPEDQEIYQKEGMITVALAWIFLCLVGCIPLVLTKEAPSFIDAYYEIVSGFTTTGSTIFSDVEALSHTTLFWRSLTHWIGGMGVLVFLLMLMPVRDGSQMNLMKAESPGPDVSKFVPKVRKTASILYATYLVLTALELVFLLLSKMRIFDAVCLTLATAGTGGFGVLNSGLADYTAIQQWIIGVFMLLFGINFTFYFLLYIRKFKTAIKMEEVRAYLFIALAATTVISISIYDSSVGFEATVRTSFFQVASIMTTTGFSTVDFNLWPSIAKMVLFVLMLIGACAGSTGGGFKVSRVLLMARSIKENRRRLIHPRSVRRIRMDGKAVDDSLMKSLMAFTSAYLSVFIISILLLSLNGFSFETNISAVAASLNNIGPGLDAVGPVCNYGFLPVLSKIVLIFDMLAGRLEIIPLLTFVSISAWKRTN